MQPVCLDMPLYGPQGKEGRQDQELSSEAQSFARRVAAAQQHPDFVLWSLLNFFFLNCCCLGFAALIFSIKSRDRKVAGDPDGAASYGKTAKCLNITLLILCILVIIIIVISVIIFFVRANTFLNMLQKQ